MKNTSLQNITWVTMNYFISFTKFINTKMRKILFNKPICRSMRNNYKFSMNNYKFSMNKLLGMKNQKSLHS